MATPPCGWRAAARTTGGKVLSLELREFKIEHARQALTRAGLSTRVEFHAGDCLETLKTLPGPFDFVLLDVWKDLYLPCFELVHPKLAPGGIIVADNMLLPEIVRPQAEAYRAARARRGRHGLGADRSRQRHRDQPQALSSTSQKRARHQRHEESVEQRHPDQRDAPPHAAAAAPRGNTRVFRYSRCSDGDHEDRRRRCWRRSAAASIGCASLSAMIPQTTTSASTV